MKDMQESIAKNHSPSVNLIAADSKFYYIKNTKTNQLSLWLDLSIERGKFIVGCGNRFFLSTTQIDPNVSYSVSIT